MRKLTLPILIIFIASIACSSIGSSSSSKERLKQCLYIPRIVITPDNGITRVKSEIENRCNEDIKSIKLTVNGSEYPGGPVVASIEASIDDLPNGEKKTFEVSFPDPNREIRAARIEIDEIH